ncbi:MAG: ABC transporter permease [Halanaerobiales bacterium]|nr:ABC transporter permease [Halanaerobiales bacterium]
MTLFNLALKNIKRSFHSYFIYFTAMVVSIMIYFTFNSLRYNPQVLSLVKPTNIMFSASSFIVAIFSVIFIWYSNSFFTRKRKKEIGLYSIFGIKKKQIGRMLFYENAFMGLLALVTGIIVASLLSKLFVMILFRLMGYTDYVNFVILPKAIIHTSIVFVVIFIVTSIRGYSIIYRFKLIELFKAEKIHEKEPKASIIVAIISILLLACAYHIALEFKFMPNLFLYVFSTIILVILGSFGFFGSSILFFIKLAKKHKKRYYQGINMIGISQLFYRIKSHARTLAMIAVLSATTLTALGFAFSLTYDLAAKIDQRNPYSYEYISLDQNLTAKIKKIIEKYPEHQLTTAVQIDFLRIKGELIDTNTSPHLPGNQFYLISQSKINGVFQALGITEQLTIEQPDQVIIFNEFFNNQYDKSYRGMIARIKYNNHRESFKVVNHRMEKLTNHNLPGFAMVVADDVYQRLYSFSEIRRFHGHNITNQKNSTALTEELQTVIPKDASLRSYYLPYRNATEKYGLTIFIGSFLGLVFLVATGSIIYFKQLTEANAEKERYQTLRKIGVSKNEIKDSIAKQILIIFALPLALGIIHSLVALTALSKIMNANLIVPITATIGIYTLIYLLYYFLTVNSYNKIVNSN